MSKSKKQAINWKEQRRLHAIELKRQCWKQADIATALKISKGAVSQWITKAKLQEEALAARPHTGCPPVLTAEEKRMLSDYLGMEQKPMGFMEHSGLVRAYKK